MNLARRTNGLRANAVANFVGQIATALLSLAFTPLYLHHIGVESFGVIGFFVALQGLFAVLDMGLTATLQRELANTNAKEPERVAPLIRTFEWIYMPGAVVILLASVLLSAWLAEWWVRPQSLTTQEVAEGIILLGVAATLQWPASFHMAAIAALERQVLLNALKIATATLSAIGCLAAVIAMPTLRGYAGWQVFMGVVQAILYAVILWKLVPRSATGAKFDVRVLKATYRFAGGLFAVTLTSVVLTQADRVVLSGFLTLEEFGYYSIAAALATILYRVAQPLFTAATPRYAQLVAADNAVALSQQYHATNQVMALILIPTAVLGAAFAPEIILAWSGDPRLTGQVAPIFQVLVVSYGLHGLVSLPYALQLAHGWTRLSLRVNLVSIILIVPLFVVLGSRFGGVGAAYAWLVLTSGYFFIGAPVMHQRLLKGELSRWYFRDIGPAAVGAALVCGVAKVAGIELPAGWSAWIALLSVWLSAVAAAALLSPDFRPAVYRRIHRLFPKHKVT